jgi:hypothetical protein
MGMNEEHSDYSSIIKGIKIRIGDRGKDETPIRDNFSQVAGKIIISEIRGELFVSDCLETG